MFTCVDVDGTHDISLEEMRRFVEDIDHVDEMANDAVAAPGFGPLERKEGKCTGLSWREKSASSCTTAAATAAVFRISSAGCSSSRFCLSLPILISHCQGYILSEGADFITPEIKAVFTEMGRSTSGEVRRFLHHGMYA